MKKQYFNIIFILGFALVFFVILDAYSLVEKLASQYKKKVSSYMYTYSYDVDFLNCVDGYFTFDEFDMMLADLATDADYLVDSLHNTDCTTYLAGYYTYIGKIKEINAPVDIVFSYKDQWYRELANGRYPTDEEIRDGERVALIGESIQDYEEVIDGVPYIYLFDEYYKVIGVYANYEMTGDDESVAIFCASTSSGVPESVYKDIEDAAFGVSMTVVIGGNTDDISEDKAKLQSNIENYENLAFINEGSFKESSVDAAIYTTIRSVILLVLYSLCLIECFALIKLLLSKRKKDITIMKIYGMSNFSIIGRIFKKVLMLLCMAFGASLILHTMFMLVFEKTALSFSVYGIGFLFILLAVVFATIYIYTYWVINKVNIVENIRK
jgi:hypothetical protein